MSLLEKTCFRCSRALPLSEFYAHSQMADGHLNKCKGCTRTDMRRHRRANGDRMRARDRSRSREPQRVALRRAERRRNRNKQRARQAVARAIKRGDLVRNQCEVCGNPKSEAHHNDYTKPLDVRWLCFFHHRLIGHGHFAEYAGATP